MPFLHYLQAPETHLPISHPPCLFSSFSLDLQCLSFAYDDLLWSRFPRTLKLSLSVSLDQPPSLPLWLVRQHQHSLTPEKLAPPSPPRAVSGEASSGCTPYYGRIFSHQHVHNMFIAIPLLVSRPLPVFSALLLFCKAAMQGGSAGWNTATA